MLTVYVRGHVFRLSSRAGGDEGLLVSIVPPLRCCSRARHGRTLAARRGACPLGTSAPRTGSPPAPLSTSCWAPSPRCLLNSNRNVSQVPKPCFDTGVTCRMLSAVPSRAPTPAGAGPLRSHPEQGRFPTSHLQVAAVCRPKA